MLLSSVLEILNSIIECNGIPMCKTHLAIRRRHDLLGMDFSVITPFDLQNIFTSNIERIVNERMIRRDAIHRSYDIAV